MKTEKILAATSAAALRTPIPEFGLKEGGAAPENIDVKELATKAGDALKQVQDFATKAAESLRKGEELSTELKGQIDEGLAKLNVIDQLKEQVDALEQKAQRGGGEPQQQKSAGYQFIENDGVKAFMQDVRAGQRVGVEVGAKAIISSLVTDADGSAGDLLVPQRVAMVQPVTRRLTVRGLLTQGRTGSNAIQYPKETGFTNSAATVTETAGTAKPQSEIKFDLVTTSVTTIAHWVLATRQILDDAPMLQSYIDGRLRYGLALVEENQLLNGGGTGTDLEGIYTAATAYAQPIVPTEAGNLTKIDVLRLALLQAALAELPSTGIVLNDMDWADIELTKTADGAYLFANPQGMVEPRLWARPVVPTQAMTVDKFLCGAFQMGAQIFDREDARVEVSTEDSDNFRKNLVTVLAEERLALAIYREEAFVKGDFSDALAL